MCRSSVTACWEGIREIPARTGRKTQWSHQRILLISEEFVRTYPIQRFLDTSIRDLELRQLTNIAITQGKAGNYLEKQPVIELMKVQVKSSRAFRNRQPNIPVKRSILVYWISIYNYLVKRAMPSFPI